MTSDKRQGSAWKRDMNKIPAGEDEEEQESLDKYIGT